MSFKETKRKGFNFFRSYYDVYNELETDKDKLAFINALLDRQFLGVKPEGLKGMAKFAWISQVNSIDSQVKGYEDKTNTKLTPAKGGGKRVELPPTQQVQVQVEEEGKVEYNNNTPPDESGDDQVFPIINKTPPEEEKKEKSSAKKETFDWEALRLKINKETGRDFRKINKTVRGKYLKLINIDEYEKSDIASAIENASKSEHHRENGCQHLTPEFFSRPDKIDMYASPVKNDSEKIVARKMKRNGRR